MDARLRELFFISEIAFDLEPVGAILLFLHHDDMTFYEAAQLAKEAEVKEMWLTHYSPSLTKPEEYMDDVKAIFPNSIAAKDKRSVELVFED